MNELELPERNLRTTNFDLFCRTRFEISPRLQSVPCNGRAVYGRGYAGAVAGDSRGGRETVRERAPDGAHLAPA